MHAYRGPYLSMNIMSVMLFGAFSVAGGSCHHNLWSDHHLFGLCNAQYMGLPLKTIQKLQLIQNVKAHILGNQS